ncbi:Do family serine endopeptidase [Acuticoccus sp. I52.16.1]|uniref:Do family serine endopeptidase n=1 Tax=Acuticoccus sp. I52.16.1 TaxID=2928472 RepID=UPI001FD181EE|nr:Do family serine endopeptidase [Acuticoccus sp. I52.16.1]UOM34142.1 Do family serine endopeptidase [Acuticoccus sp. I52.16.1]
MSLITRQLCAAVTGALLAISPMAATTYPAWAQDQGPRSVADLADSLLGSVVNVSTTERVVAERSAPMPGGEEAEEGEDDAEEPYRDFFEDFFGEDGPPQRRRAQSMGSGFVISADGYVVTNNHVIKDAEAVVVNFADGTVLDAEIVGRDPKTDIALLKVEPETPLNPLDFASTENLRVGDWVMAIGNPFGLGGTVTIGIVSARNRNLRSGPYDNFIQTDAAINQGNSGGPLFNMGGDVVGINTAIISRSGGSVGIGFAIPAEIATAVIDQLRQYGETRRGWLGVRLQKITPELATSLGLDKPRGAFVAGVTAGGPAETSGLQTGDVVLSYDGHPIAEMRELPLLVAQTEIDSSVDVGVLREGEEITVAVTIGLLEEDQARAEPELATTPEAEAEEPATEAPTAVDPASEAKMTLLGMGLSPLTDELRQTYDIAAEVAGVIVVDIEAGSLAAEKRISAGDVIIEVGQKPVTTPQEVADQVEALKERNRNTALLTLSSANGALRFTALRIEQ